MKFPVIKYIISSIILIGSMSVNAIVTVPSDSASSIAEPASISLIVLGIVCIGLARKRQKS